MQALRKLFQIQLNTLRSIHTTRICARGEDRKEMIRSMPVKDDGTEGEKNISIDSLIQHKYVWKIYTIFNENLFFFQLFCRKKNIFPDEDTPNTLFHGIPFKDLPIINVRSSKNNTIVGFTDSKGLSQMIRSCGMEGFKNTRKGTNIAAQATAITLGTKVLERGTKVVRVTVRGIGPGRMSAIKGLQMSGLEIVSITDCTPVSWNPPRARKQRKL